MSTILNDVHSRLNATEVARVERPTSLDELKKAILRARERGERISIAGGRHAMGGQQFAAGSVNIDMTGLTMVLSSDAAKGLLHIEAGADWTAIIAATRAMPQSAQAWGIRQKQTGVDAVTLGGSISASAHGRGLLMKPMGEDIEDLTLVDGNGQVLLCSRMQNAELFSLVVGGYGLFGVIYSATLRLAPRQRVQRFVDIIDLDDAMNAVYRRAEEGCLYGDFQFVIDAKDDNFLRRGVFACYRPSEDGKEDESTASDLPPDAWLKLLKLAHEDKRAAFRLYSQHYLNSDGNHYWSDTMQLSTYIPSYVDFINSEQAVEEAGGVMETLVIGEHYVPPARLLEFMRSARGIFRNFGTEIIYGTIRAIQPDTTSFLPWAREEFACVIFNIRTRHDESGLRRTADTFRALMDACGTFGGSFFLTYHHYASVAQVERCYPRFREFLGLKGKYDPGELFTSTWYEHYRDAFAREPAR